MLRKYSLLIFSLLSIIQFSSINAKAQNYSNVTFIGDTLELFVTNPEGNIQWQQTDDTLTTWVDIPNATTNPYIHLTESSTTDFKYYRARINNSGSCYAYSDVIINKFIQDCGTVNDIDGNIYNSVQIGNQCWMRQNLKVTHYSNGLEIPLIIQDSVWSNLASDDYSDAFCYYNGDSINANIYGALYSWAAAMGDSAISSNIVPSGVQGVCPNGWHLPSMQEWVELAEFLGGIDVEVAGGKMKQIGTNYWNSPNEGATNESGFSALPGGLRATYFSQIGEVSYYWSSTESFENNTYAYYCDLKSHDSKISIDWDYGKFHGFSVRCVKD